MHSHHLKDHLHHLLHHGHQHRYVVELPASQPLHVQRAALAARAAQLLPEGEVDPVRSRQEGAHGRELI